MPATERSNSRISMDRPSASATRPEGREQLHHAEHRAAVEKAAVARVHDREHDTIATSSRYGRSEGLVSLRDHAALCSPRVCSMMTPSTMTPMIRYCICWLKP